MYTPKMMAAESRPDVVVMLGKCNLLGERYICKSYILILDLFFNLKRQKVNKRAEKISDYRVQDLLFFSSLCTRIRTFLAGVFNFSCSFNKSFCFCVTRA